MTEAQDKLVEESRCCGGCTFFKTDKCRYAGVQEVHRADEACQDFHTRENKRNLRGEALEQYIRETKEKILGGEALPLPYESLEQFYDNLACYFQTYLRIPDDIAILFATYTLLTSQIPNLDFMPMLYVTGRKGSGKSTAGERLETLCYRGFKTGSATFPALVRLNEVLNSMTQLIDEADLVLDQDYMTKYLRGSTDRRNPYLVIDQVKIGNATYNLPVVKNSFGARIIITAQQPRDEMVRDRCIEVVMMPHTGYVAPPPPELIEKLRGNLVYYRQQVKIQPTPADYEKYYDTKKHSGRLNEIAASLFLVTPPKYHLVIQRIINSEFEIRTGLERESLLAKIIESLTEVVLHPDEMDIVSTTEHGDVVTNRAIKARFDLINGDKQTGKGKISTQSIGRNLKNAGLPTYQVYVADTKKTTRGWPVDISRLVEARRGLYLDVDELLPTLPNSDARIERLLVNTTLEEERRTLSTGGFNIGRTGREFGNSDQVWPQICQCGFAAIDPYSLMNHKCSQTGGSFQIAQAPSYVVTNRGSFEVSRNIPGVI
ncbi:MAG: hypothetical protein V1857_06880 [archaeon]